MNGPEDERELEERTPGATTCESCDNAWFGPCAICGVALSGRPASSPSDQTGGETDDESLLEAALDTSHAAEVNADLRWDDPERWAVSRTARKAVLDRCAFLRATVERLERDLVLSNAELLAAEEAIERRDATVARLEGVIAKGSEEQSRLAGLLGQAVGRLTASEREVVRLREAVERIAHPWDDPNALPASRIARAALASSPTERPSE